MTKKTKFHNISLVIMFAVSFSVFMVTGSKLRSQIAEANEMSKWTIIQRPRPTATPTIKPPLSKDLPSEYSEYQIDAWVTYYTIKYFPEGGKRNHAKQLLHCLLYREAGYGSNKGHGDNGKAGGPLQYHQPTWDGFRKIMLKKNLIKEIGSRYDMEQAIETTAWAISDNRALNWGPFLRKECE